MSTVRNVLFGFIAGALAVLLFHQAMYWLIANYGSAYGLPALRGRPFNFQDTVPFMPDLLKALKYAEFRVPSLANQMVWGGLWGALFGLIINRLPGPIPIKAIIFALIGPMLIGSWLIFPLVSTPQRPLFSGFLNSYDWKVLANGFLLNGVAFGIGLGILFSIMRGIGLVPSPRAEHAY